MISAEIYEVGGPNLPEISATYRHWSADQLTGRPEGLSFGIFQGLDLGNYPYIFPESELESLAADQALNAFSRISVDTAHPIAFARTLGDTTDYAIRSLNRSLKEVLPRSDYRPAKYAGAIGALGIVGSNTLNFIQINECGITVVDRYGGLRLDAFPLSERGRNEEVVFGNIDRFKVNSRRLEPGDVIMAYTRDMASTVHTKAFCDLVTCGEDITLAMAEETEGQGSIIVIRDSHD